MRISHNASMRAALIPHPTTPPQSALGLEASLSLQNGRLRLGYVLTGATQALILPAEQENKRTDGLWQTTCFEAFFMAPDHTAYAELNFAPSTAWAAYHFTAYRQNMQIIAPMANPQISVERPAHTVALQAELDASILHSAAGKGPWRVALTAVLEEANGRKSYWSIAHAPDKPDFHHSAGFALTLNPTEDA